MKNTVNRTPGQISTVGSDSRMNNLNLMSFEGITDNENDITVSPSTFTAPTMKEDGPQICFLPSGHF